MDQFQRSAPTTPLSPRLAARIQHARRGLAFVGQIVRALLDDIDLAAIEADERTLASIGPVEARLAGAARRVEEGERLLATVEGLAELPATRAIATFEQQLTELTALVRALQGEAAAWRRAGKAAPAAPIAPGPSATPAPPAATGPSPRSALRLDAGTSRPLTGLAPGAGAAAGQPPGAAAAGGTGAAGGATAGGGAAASRGAPTRPLTGAGLPASATGRLRPLPPQPTLVAQSATLPAPEGAVEQAVRVFQAVHRFVSGLLDYVSPRLTLLDVALKAVGPPGKPAPWPTVQRAIPGAIVQAAVPPADRGWIAPLAQLFHGDQGAARRGRVAIVQWERARVLHADAKQIAANLAQAASPQHRLVLGDFSVPQYSAAAHPLKHLHLSFKGIAHLERIFPPPAEPPAAPARPRTFTA